MVHDIHLIIASTIRFGSQTLRQTFTRTPTPRPFTASFSLSLVLDICLRDCAA
jgi:hypothetical protein